ncbi:Tautomerase/MIF [Macrolepiota fuliginosa MF-IS2]|uniref:L-dopachrome isomerase n=1 Tax=Macrolepiota fuliginosa MF-IS2 TaxID=1400762 RepID=A0A9P6C4K8_9AGAR|nr:Tautomerase/MIF [Macrolepiota fuliginosa MF-IS2]
MLIGGMQIADPKAFALEFSKFGAEVLGKPEAYITVQYQYNETITFGGTFDPAFTLKIFSLGNLSHDKNEQYSKTISEWLGKKLGLKNDRGYIVFIDPGNSYIGYVFQGTTFGTIFGSKS